MLSFSSLRDGVGAESKGFAVGKRAQKGKSPLNLAHDGCIGAESLEAMAFWILSAEGLAVFEAPRLPPEREKWPFDVCRQGKSLTRAAQTKLN